MVERNKGEINYTAALQWFREQGEEGLFGFGDRLSVLTENRHRDVEQIGARMHVLEVIGAHEVIRQIAEKLAPPVQPKPDQTP